MANEDKILSENYFQHADHFTRVLSEQEKNRLIKAVDDIDKNELTGKIEEKKEDINIKKNETEKKTISN